jgi:hypothetical protein
MMGWAARLRSRALDGYAAKAPTTWGAERRHDTRERSALQQRTRANCGRTRAADGALAAEGRAARTEACRTPVALLSG